MTQRYRPFYLLLSFFLLLNYAHAQIELGGTPPSFRLGLDNNNIETINTPAIDLEALLEEDSLRALDNMPYRFARPFPVSYNLNTVGSWTDLPNGDRIWQLRINCQEALSVNLLYDDFFIPNGGLYYIYSADRTEILGAFGPHNNKPSRKFATAMVHSTSIILEYFEPAAVRGEGMISVSQIAHGYRFFPETDEGLGDAGSCQVNINCSPEGDDWQIVKKSVARITLNGSELCTGSLINTVANDCRPYFLSANHCFDPTYDAINNNDLPGMVCYFNYERPGCANTGSVPNETTSGAILLANPSVTSDANGSDFALFELLEDPSDVYDVYFAGFNATNNPGNGGVGIHHPRGDAKKIATHSTIPPVVVNDNYWRIFWDDTPNGFSVTEGGSSGSGLFDNNGNLIGQLFGGFLGGQPNCSDPANDEGDYGRLFISWDNRGASDARRRLRDWLDPDDTGIRTVSGRTPCSANPDYELSADPVAQTSCGDNSVDYTISVESVNGFSDAVTLSANGLPAGASAVFSPNPVSPGSSSTLTISGLGAVAEGSYNFNVAGSSTTGNKSIGLALTVIVPKAATLLNPADGSTVSTTMPNLSWAAEPNTDSYEVQVATDNGFLSVVASANVTTTNWTVTPTLAANTTYFWRVRHVRSCGNDPWSAPFSFTTPNISCFTAMSSNVPLPINNTQVTTSEITITATGSISDVDVFFTGTHGRVRDMTFELQSPSGTRIQLVDLNDPCNGRQRDFNFGFNDESALTIDDDLPCPPNNGGIYQPEQALSAFDGEQINGTWTLLITDDRRSQNGELTAWQIDYCLGTSTPTCDDGIQNGLETGIDCGGPDCPPCDEPTCEDGIQNGLETGVDCGGPDCPPCMMEMCDTPTGLFETNNTGTSVTLNWTDVPAANDYTVQGRQQGVSAWQLTLTATTNSITISNNIVPGVTYEWRVRSNCDDGSSPYSEVASFVAGSSAGNLENRNATIAPRLNARLYPSPTQDVLTVLVNQPIVELEILDITGRRVRQMRIENDLINQQINVATLAEGHYLLRLRTERGFEVLRFVKQ